MKLSQWILCGAAVAAMSCVATGSALAATVSGRSSTVLEWLDDPAGDQALPFYQYLQLNVQDLGTEGLDFRGYGRFGDDLEDEVDAESRLYYGYLEKKDLLSDLDVRLGRQFINVSAGASVMDGLYLDYRGFPVDLTLFGGGDVSYYEGYTAEDVIAGLEISGTLFQDLDLGLSYLQKWDGGHVARKLIGFEGQYNFQDQLSLYADLQYDWLTDGVSYALGGARYYGDPDWALRAEYLYSLPVFDATSIYSVFAVSEYEELMLEGSYNLQPGLRAFGRYTREIYDDFEDADVYEAGLEKIRTERFSGYLTGVLREDGDGQDLKGFKTRAAYLITKNVQAGVGLELDVLRRSLDAFGGGKDDFDDTTSKRLWADATIYVTDSLSVQVKTEKVQSALYDSYYRGRLRVNLTF